MKLSAADPKRYHMQNKLHERIAAKPHESYNTDREQRDGHNDDLYHPWHVHPHKLGVSNQQQQKRRFYRVACLKHPAE